MAPPSAAYSGIPMYPPYAPYGPPSNAQNHIPFPTQGYQNAPANNPTPSATSTGRKRASASTSSGPAPKRTRTTNVPTGPSKENMPPSPAVPGVGPFTNHAESSSSSGATRETPVPPRPAILKPKKIKAEGKAAASDAWWFTRPLKSREKPSVMPNEGIEDFSRTKRSRKEFPWVGCRLCPHDKWHTWENGDGVGNTIRKHLKAHHLHEYRAIVKAEKLKGWQTIDATAAPDATDSEDTEESRPPFTVEGFMKRLVRWIVVDDQSVAVIDCKELRDLLLYLNEDLGEGDIPHRTQLTKLIFESYEREHKAMVEDIKCSLGRVSFTSDMWSAPNTMASYMAITAHYAAYDPNGALVIKSRLVAFRHVEGSHSGAHMADYFIQVVREIGVLDKIGMITLDNASTCHTMMEELQWKLLELDIPFSAEGNRVRCFPHVINLAVKAGIDAHTKVTVPPPMPPSSVPPPSVPPSSVPPPSTGPAAPTNGASARQYAQALANNPIASCRSLVAQCRASGQRREDFASCIKEGNESGAFKLSVWQLLRDVDTRWSSTFFMMNRVLDLYPAIDAYLSKTKQSAIAHYKLTAVQLEVLEDICIFLAIPHSVQELLSGQKTPTLSAVLPAYEELLEMLKLFRVQTPRLAHMADAAIAKIEEYVARSRKTKIYALAMIINPTSKLSWIEEHWSSEEAQEARESMYKAMLEHQQASSLVGPEPSRREPVLDSGVIASNSLRRGQANVQFIKAQLKNTSSSSSFGSNASASSSGTSRGTQETPGTSTPIDTQAELRRKAERDKHIAREELLRYTEDRLVTENELADSSLTLWWQAQKHKYPLMFRVALDILPVQASAVPCERVFSSSKDTCTARRTNLSPALLECLQVLKYFYKQERLDFTSSWISTEDDMTHTQDDGDSPSAEDAAARYRELIAQGKLDDLARLLNEGVASLL